MLYWQNKMGKLYCGHVLEELKAMPDESVQCGVTSIPYYGLRSYKTEPQVWGGRQDCQHEFVETEVPNGNGTGTSFRRDRKAWEKRGGLQPGFCTICGAWKGELGLEPDPFLYVEHVVSVFREFRRVLRKDGCLWLNCGDSYCGGGRAGNNPEYYEKHKMFGKTGWDDGVFGRPQPVPEGFKPKDLLEMPSMVVQALRVDGWYLRQRIPWIKKNCMPESVTDRPTTAIEYIFLLSKSEEYFYDREAVAEGCVWSGENRHADPATHRYHAEGIGPRLPKHRGLHLPSEKPEQPGTRNRRNSDWFMESWQGLLSDENGDPLAMIVNPKGFKGAHFATFPEDMVEPCILAGTSERGACPTCGAPWKRVVDKGEPAEGRGSGNKERKVATEGERSRTNTHLGSSVPWQPENIPTLGWSPTCTCYGIPIMEDPPRKRSKEPGEEYQKRLDAWYEIWNERKPRYDVLPTVPCVVMDMFVGSGTTPVVAEKLERRWVAIDLQPDYVKMAIDRIARVNPLFH